MHVLAARISKTAIPRRTRGPDDRRGQLRFVAGVWLAIVNPVRRRGALMVLRMHSVTVGMAGNNESSPAGEMLSWCHGCTVLQSVWPAMVNAVRQRGALMVLWMHSVTVDLAGDSESSPPARCSHGVMDAHCYSRDGGDGESSPPARCSHGVMDGQCYSRDGGDSESSPAGMIGVVGTVGQTAGHDRR
jgi:hypothetical protein